MKTGDRPADRAADPRPGEARPARPHAGRPGQRIQPRHDDRGRPRQHGQRSVAGRDRRDEGDDPLRPAPALHRLRLRRPVRRRHEDAASSTARRPPERPLPGDRRIRKSRSATCTRRSSRRWASRRARPSTWRSGRSIATEDGKGASGQGAVRSFASVTPCLRGFCPRSSSRLLLQQITNLRQQLLIF